MLNCDWFQPFQHTQFSVGVLYIAVQNLPRAIRFRQENILIVGIMPGPSEPTMNVNSYLDPLIEDLLALWSGVAVSICGEKKIRAALSYVACDVPAARKIGGFVGLKGRRGCSRCLKEFPVNSGFVKSEWEARTHALHVWYGLRYKRAKTLEERKIIDQQSGARYTSLLELPYYRPVSSCVVDPMHCLFLGIAKTFFKTWIAHSIISAEDFLSIQQKVDSFDCPPDIGRLPPNFQA